MTSIGFPNKRILLFLLVVAGYILIQWPGLTAPFSHGDDQLEVAFVNGLDSPLKLLGPDVFGLFRPVKNVLFALFSWLSSFGIVYCRAIAVLIGLFSFACVWRFSTRILANGSLALLAAAVWLLSPTLVSSAAWLSCVNIQLMCALAALAGICHWDDKPGHAALWLVLACLSYEQAVVVGPCLIVLDFFLRPERLRERRSYLRYALYAAVTVAYLAVRTLVGSSQLVNGSFVGCTRLDLSGASAYLTGLHFSTWFWPFGRMAVFGGYAKGDVSTALLVVAWLATALLFVLILQFRKNRPVLALGLAWAWVAFLPLGNLAGLRNGPYGDYYLGLSSMGFAWAGVALLAFLTWRGRRVYRFSHLFALALIVVFFAVRLLGIGEAYVWSRQWADPESAYRATIRTFPRAYFAHVMLARFLCDRGQYEEAEAECAVAESLMAGESKKLAASHIIRALVAMLHRGNADEAEKWLLMSAEEDCDSAKRRLCHYYLGCVYEDLRNDSTRAEAEYAAAMPNDGKWDADTVRTADRYARLLALRGEMARAIEIWERAAVIAPADATIVQNLETAKRLANKK